MDYVTAIGLGLPGVECHCFGDPTVYENLVWDGGVAMPSKTTLDEWIAANEMAGRTKITVLAFRNRFTQSEKIALELAALDNPTADMSVRQQAAALRASMADLAAATFVDLARTDTILMVQQLEAGGLIGAGRATQILSTVPTSLELSPFN